MPTIAQVINSYSIPELNIIKNFKENRSYIEIKAGRPRFDECHVQKWDTFENDLAKYDSYLNCKFDGCLTEYDNDLVVSSVNCVIGEFQLHIKRPFLKFLESLGYKHYVRRPDGMPSIKLDPGLVLTDCNSETPICLFEFDTPWEFPITENLDIAAHVHTDNSSTDIYSDKVKSAVAQLYGYLVCNNMKYGILSNYNYFIFFYRPEIAESTTLLYSRPVPYRQILPTLVKFYFLIVQKPFHSASPTQSLSESLEPFEHGNNQLQLISSNQYRVIHKVADMRNGGVFLASVGGNNPCKMAIFKVKNICRDHGIAQVLQDEADKYRALECIQGLAIPIMYGLVDIFGVFHALVTQDCGKDLSKDENQIYVSDLEVKNNAIQALNMLHECGYLHGDIADRNICVLNKKVMLIDLEHAVPCNDAAKFAKEKKELIRIFRV